MKARRCPPDKHQTIVWAGAFGDANESIHLPEILDGIKKNCKEAGIDDDIYKSVMVTADSGELKYNGKYWV
ncbi:MAG: hypothetical protein JW874_02100 [Spirochaetales bacterium]|nr:hypothetical protein [Spirochaetales bacterium]